MSGMANNQEKPPHSTAPPSPRQVARRRGPAPPSGTSPARRRAATILEVLAGVRRPIEAAQALGTSLPRYYQLERRALTGLLSACEPAARGPRVDPTRELAKLERENQRLQRECDRQQALVRMAERSLGLTAPAAVRPAVKGKEDVKNGSRKRRRPRRASVRALQVVRGLHADDGPEAPDVGAVESVATESG
jgi:hypothetical protein